MEQLDLCIVMQSIISVNREESFVGIYGEVDDNSEFVHTGLVICIDNVLWLLHFDADGVQLEVLEDITEDMYFIKLGLYGNDNEVGEFFAYCKFIRSKILPGDCVLCYLIDDSYFKMDENNFLIGSKSGLMLGTCVGFCLKVLDGDMLEHRYVELDDWTGTSLNDSKRKWSIDRITKALEVKKMDYEMTINENDFKRITPIELMTSGLFTSYPIRKNSIDDRLVEVNEHLVICKKRGS